jgi:hypothetical protein
MLAGMVHGMVMKGGFPGFYQQEQGHGLMQETQRSNNHLSRKEI